MKKKISAFAARYTRNLANYLLTDTHYQSDGEKRRGAVGGAKRGPRLSFSRNFD